MEQLEEKRFAFCCSSFVVFTMLRKPLTVKLPTLNQFLTESESKSSDLVAQIEKIMWSDEWKSITFFTDEFRYTIKGKDRAEYDSMCGEVLDAIQAKKHQIFVLEYSGETGEVEVLIDEYTDKSPYPPCIAKQFDWGITIEEIKIRTQTPARQTEPSSKAKKAATKPDETPF